MWRLLVLICLQLTFITAVTKEKTCPDDQFQCDNGSCISMSWRCDDADDCMDGGGDERGCPKKTCADEYFQCDSGNCIPDRWVCDGSPDCMSDDSDEKPELCANKTCDGYRCQETDQCIPSEWQCDGKNDCHKGDDEKDCSRVCPDDQFECIDSSAGSLCVDKSWVCDGHDDCLDGSDEANCSRDCDEDHFKCHDGQCINDHWYCDGDADCKDGSDEVNCTAVELMKKTCESNFFQCATPLNEAKCIEAAWRCDGDSDCSDDSDEKDCDFSTKTCPPDEKMCVESMYCLKKELFCDQQEDCLDGSDERNCTYNVTPKPNCEENQFDCSGDGSKCILDTYRCDGNDDCGNFKDEHLCPAKNMCKKDNGGCQHLCVPTTTPPGRVCECNAGYKLVDGSETDCGDIDECKIRGTCSQICINRKGTYKCECQDEYVLTDHRYCKAKKGNHTELILSDDYDIRRYELSHFHYTLLLDDKQVMGAVAMDFDIRKGMVYWAGTHGVFSANLATAEVNQVLKDNVKSTDGLAVDWVHGNLYISDTGYNHIAVSRLDGTNSKVLLSEDLDEPRALVVNPYHGWMYWTDWGSDPKIEKCGMNGKERKAIVTKNIGWPNGLAIDYVDNRLYWVDAKEHHIGSTDMDGNDFRLVLRGHRRLGHPFAITVFEDYIYWTDWIDNAVHKMSKFGTGNVTTIAVDLKTPYDVRVYHIYRQPAKMNHCGDNYGGCSHLCLPVPQHVTSTQAVKRSECACPDGMTLENGRQCVNGSETGTVVPKPSKPSIPNTEGNANRPNAKSTPKPDEVTTVEKTATATTKVTEQETTVSSTITEGGHLNGTQGSEDSSPPVGPVAGIAIAVILGVAVFLGIVIFIVVRRYKKKNVKSMNFDNPVYRKTTTDDQLIMDKDSSRIERESMQPLNQEPEIV